MEWKEDLLGNLIDALIDYRGKTPKKQSFGIPLITAKIIKNGSISEPTEFISEDQYHLWMTRGFPVNGDVILTTEAPLGEVAQLDFRKVALAQRVVCFRGKKNMIDNTYLKYYFLSYYGQQALRARETGTTVTGIKQSELKKVIVKYPSFLFQRKIAGILSALDSKIENNNKINANLEAQAEALFKSWFVDFTPFKDQPFVDSELGPIPQGWKVGKLGDYCEVKSGYAFKSSWWTNKGYKIIKIKNISENGDINLNDCSCVLPENCDKAKNFIANTGDIVIAMTGATIGKFNIIPKIDEKFYINQRVGKFFLGEKPIEKVPYIYCFLKQENISTQIIQKGQGSAQPNISGADIESIPMLTPMSIILKYNKMCQPLFEKILSNRLESKKLSALRDTLLPKLMSGEIKL